MNQRNADLIAWEADAILDHARRHKPSLTTNFETLAREVEARAFMHLRGPMHARAVAAALRRRVGAPVGEARSGAQGRDSTP
jgi:hypothetical protein